MYHDRNSHPFVLFFLLTWLAGSGPFSLGELISIASTTSRSVAKERDKLSK